MRNEDEIIRAHDLLVGIIPGEVDLIVSDRNRDAICGAADVLCWVLGHDHNDTFAGNLKQIEQTTRDAGYELRSVQ